MTQETQSTAVLRALPKRIIRNTLYNTAGNWILLGFNFIIVPYIVKRLGVEIYGGVWILGNIVIAYAGLFDLGIGSSCVKYISEYLALKDYDGIERVISTSMAFFACFAVLLILCLAFFGKPLLPLVGVPSEMAGDALFVIAIATLIIVMTKLFTPLTSVITAMQRMDITNVIVVSANIWGLIQTFIILELGLGVKGLIVGSFIVQGISTFWMVLRVRSLLPEVRPSRAKVKWETFRQLWRYGANLQVSGISQIVVFQTDKLFALRFFGASNAAFYEVAVKVTSLARSIPLVLTSALLPAASEMDAKKEDLKVEQLFARASRYLIIIGILLVGFVFLESRYIVTTWMGGAIGPIGIDTASLLIRILIAGYFLNMATGVASTLAAGMGRTDLERRTGILMLVAFPVLMVLLLKLFGFYGIALSSALTLSAGAVYFMHTYGRVFKKGLGELARISWKPLLSGLIAISAAAVSHKLLFPGEIATRVQGIFTLGSIFLVYGAVYAAGILLFRSLDEYDRVIVSTLLRKLRIGKR